MSESKDILELQIKVTDLVQIWERWWLRRKSQILTLEILGAIWSTRARLLNLDTKVVNLLFLTYSVQLRPWIKIISSKGRRAYRSIKSGRWTLIGSGKSKTSRAPSSTTIWTKACFQILNNRKAWANTIVTCSNCWLQNPPRQST